MLTKKTKIFLAGHNGMVGSAILNKLKKRGFKNIKYQNSNQLNLLDQKKVNLFFLKHKFDLVILCAAKVGGILANRDYPAEFIHQNLVIQNNVINSSYESGVKKFLFLGSSCIYPKYAKQPINENELLNGYLESTNESYAIAKIAGIKLCEAYNIQYGLDYRSVMPTNLFGPNDNFDPKSSHVVHGLIIKIHNGKIKNKKEVILWGTGRTKRELMYVEDMADACLHLIDISKNKIKKIISPRQSHINIGSGNEVTIKQLATKIAKIIGYKGKIVFDKSYPDGTPRKKLNSKKMNLLGWRSKRNLDDSLKDTYQWFLKNLNS